jgi:P2 family phage contractile tail tube protein
MKAAAQILKNFNLYVDGRGYAGNVEEVQLPALNIAGEEYRAGGLDIPVDLDMGMDKLEASFRITKWESDIEKLFGTGYINLTFRGALEDLDGTVRACVVKLRGKIHGIESEAVTPGAKAARSYRVPLVGYTYIIDGETIHDIDVLNMKRIINGVDRLAEQRKAIGI